MPKIEFKYRAKQIEVKQADYGVRSLQLTIFDDSPFQVALPRMRPIEQQFNQLARQWEVETGASSVLSQKILHPAYQRIIGMG
ncbi:MAG: hypothetical protein F6K30_27625, partial [Cyanothece sp. SIO2G6]|nr:hypothetical protein [Cyanothece sp. SIO2G6]